MRTFVGPAFVRHVRARPLGDRVDGVGGLEPGGDLASDRGEHVVGRHVLRRTEQLVELVAAARAGKHVPADGCVATPPDAGLDEGPRVHDQPLVRLVHVERSDLGSPVVDVAQHPRDRPDADLVVHDHLVLAWRARRDPRLVVRREHGAGVAVLGGVLDREPPGHSTLQLIAADAWK